MKQRCLPWRARDGSAYRAGFGWALVVLAGAVVLIASGCTVWRMQEAAALAALSEPYEQSGAGFDASAGRLLIVGDSTAVGTGASSPRASVAGLIGRDFPGLSITNRARDGARFVNIAQQLRGADTFDVVLVLGGGNDVIRMTRHEHMVEGVRSILAAAREKAPVVIFMPPGNVGNAPFFFPPWSWLMTRRSRELHAVARAESAHSGAMYVSSFAERSADPFAQEPRRFNAADGLHPSDAGYALWYAAINQQAGLGARLRALQRASTGVMRVRSVEPSVQRGMAGG